MQPTTATVPDPGATRQDALYRDIAPEYAAPLRRLARGYERDAARREELLQDIHFALWRSLSQFDGRCSLRTWVYRVAHNVASTYVMQRRRAPGTFLTLDEVAELPDPAGNAAVAEHRHDVERLLAIIERLKPLDRQLVLLYLEGLEGAEIGAIAGMSPGSVATRIHRIKQVLKQRFGKRGSDHE